MVIAPPLSWLSMWKFNFYIVWTLKCKKRIYLGQVDTLYKPSSQASYDQN